MQWMPLFRVKSLRYCAIAVAALAASACGPTRNVTNADECRAVNLTTARNNVDNSGRGTATIAIDPKDVSLRALLCLADRLEQEHPGWTKVRAAIFDSTDAADHYSFEWRAVNSAVGQRRELAYESLRRALYVVDESAGVRYLELRLFGSDDQRYKTRIDLPTKGQPRCPVEVNRRCLLVAHAPVVSEGSFASLSGSITLSAEVQRDGTFKSVRVTKAAVAPPEATEFLTSRVAASLQTWKLDSASSEDQLTIDYEFVNDVDAAPTDAPRGLLEPIVEMSSPTHLVVRQRVWAIK